MSNTSLPRIDRDDEVEFLVDRCYYRCKPFTGVLFELDDEGGLRTDYEYVDGYEDGLLKEWHSNGQLWAEDSSRRHLPHGHSLRWNDRGQLMEEYFSE